MHLKRLAVSLGVFALLAAGPAPVAQAKQFALTGGGGQVHIGNGLMLPIQAAAMATTTGTVFPPLLIPVNGTPVLSGTVMKPLLTAMATTMGPVTKQGYQRVLSVPASALEKVAAQTTVGVKFSNPVVFAVGTNVGYEWPAAAAVFNTTAPSVAPNTLTVPGPVGSSLTYSNTLGNRFGGPAQFRLTPTVAGGVHPAIAVTVYIKINATTPACTHNAFGGTDPGCVAGLLAGGMTVTSPAAPILLGHGAMTATTVMIPNAPVPAPNVAVVQLGTAPLGTVIMAVAAAAATLPTNDATSQGGPFTTGQVIIANGAAGGAAETFTLEGRDDRTVGGAGTIQLVSGAVSDRTTSGPNANRAWVRLTLTSLPKVPSMQWWGLATLGALVLLSFGYATRRRIFA